jgi:hypothetical protein
VTPWLTPLFVNGPAFERFLLKVLLGGVAASSYGHGGEPVRAVRSAGDDETLLRVLFFGEGLPAGWGLFASLTAPDPHGPQQAIGMTTSTRIGRHGLGQPSTADSAR